MKIRKSMKIRKLRKMMKFMPCLLLALLLFVWASGCGRRPGTPAETTALETSPAGTTAAETSLEDITEGTTEEKTEGTTEGTTAETTEETAEETAEASSEETDMAEQNTEWNIDDEFYSTEITEEIFGRMRGKSFKDDCTLPVEELRYLHVLHKDLDGSTKEGEMICNRHIAEDLLEIFRELYDSGYPIEKMRLVDEYDAEDEASMADNNSSCFNFRTVSYSRNLSKHSYGLAVDINPLYNPYIKTVNGMRSVEPANGVPYVDRSRDFPYKIEHPDDLCLKLFLEHGFQWGGYWQNSKDYQHFQIPSEQVRAWYPGR